LKTIATVNPALYSGLAKILSFLAIGKESTDSLAIHKGILVDLINTGIIRADLTELFQENSIEFLDPNKSTKLMGLLRGGEEIIFLDDEENNQYHITNLFSTITIPKASVSKTVSAPEFDTVISQLNIDAKVVQNIFDAQKTLEAEKMILMLNPDTKEIIGVDINNNYEYLFNTEYDGEREKYNLFNFRPIKGSEYTYKIVKKNDSDDLWLALEIDLDLITVEYYEKLTTAGEFDAFSLY